MKNRATVVGPHEFLHIKKKIKSLNSVASISLLIVEVGFYAELKILNLRTVYY